ncbi:glycosyltransferase [Candidatus Omnitrophota bacterium]
MPSERIILMYISEVSGHHSATLAIEGAIRRLSSKAEILNINAFNYTNPVSEKVINRLYIGLIKKAPKIWDYLYDNPAVVRKIENIKNKIHKYNSPKLKKLFDEFRPQAVACTQAFPCGMVADYKKTYGSCLPLVAVLTDYIPHSYWVYKGVDHYITPSEEVSKLLAAKGVADKRIEAFGIPFDHKFNQRADKKEVLSSLSFDPDKKTILIMGGGQGLGPIKAMINSLDKINKDFQMVVVTGTNKRLFAYLNRKARKYKKKTAILSRAGNINELMDISDFIITKPGGVTTAEALVKNLPMVIIKPIPGQEASNTVYLTEKGAAVKIDRLEELKPVIEGLLEDPDRLSSMRAAARASSKPNASEDIARLLLDSCHKNV